MARPNLILNDDKTRKLFEGFGKLALPIIEVAMMLGVTRQTVSSAMVLHPELREAYEKGRVNLHSRLRTKQIDSALDGNVPMLIWLGKQLLDQRDQIDISTISEIEALTIEDDSKPVTYEEALLELENLKDL